MQSCKLTRCRSCGATNTTLPSLLVWAVRTRRCGWLVVGEKVHSVANFGSTAIVGACNFLPRCVGDRPSDLVITADRLVRRPHASVDRDQPRRQTSRWTSIVGRHVA